MLYTSLHHRFAAGAGLWGAIEGARPTDLLRERAALARGVATVGQKGRLGTLEDAPLPKHLQSLFAMPVDRPGVDLHLRVVLLSHAIVTGPQPFDLPDGALLRALQAAPCLLYTSDAADE